MNEEIFIFVLTILSFLFVFVHHMLRPNEKIKVNGIVENIKSKIMLLGFTSFAHEEASFLVKRFKTNIGAPATKQAFKRLFILGYVITVFYMFMLFALRTYQCDPDIQSRSKTDGYLLDSLYSIFIANPVGNALVLWLSYMVTYKLVSRISALYSVNYSQESELKNIKDSYYQHQSAIGFIKYFIIDVLLILIVAIISLQIVYSLHDIYYYILYKEIKYLPDIPQCDSPILLSLAPIKILNGVQYMFGYPQSYICHGMLNQYAFGLIFISAIPTLIHIFTMFLFVLPRILPNWSLQIVDRVLSILVKPDIGIFLGIAALFAATVQVVKLWPF